MSNSASLLVVDDTLESLRVVTEMLTSEGYRVRPADGGSIALASARVDPPELILLDVRMPDIGGFDVCRELKSDPRTRDIPVIFLSASTEFPERVEGFRLGAVDFVTKPYQREELLARVRTHLELSRLRLQLESQVQERTLALSASNARLEGEIAERKLAEHALSVSHARLLLAMGIAKLGYWEYDVDSDTFTFDAEFFKLYGTSIEQEGSPTLRSADYVARFVPPDDARMVREAILSSIIGAQAGPVPPVEHRMLRADGSLGHVLVRYVVVKDEHGRTVRTYGVNQDISERKLAEIALDELRHTQKLDSIGRLAGGIAHDFNNLLTVITGHLELISVMRKPEEVQRHAREAGNAATSAAALTRQLLMFARKQPTAPAALALNDVVMRTDSMLRRLIGEDIRLELNVTPSLPKVFLDPGQAEQVLINLVVNARDAMPSGGRLTITTRLAEAVPALCARHGVPPPRQGFVVLSVADSGTGMDAAVLGRIFEPFFTTKAVGKGTGIGLATVQSVVKQAAGFIEVHSTLGEGSCFEVYLPVSEQVAAPAPQVSDEVLPSGHGERVLLVEDQPAVRALACGQLALLGYAVQSFASAEECLELLADPGAYADLIVTDVVLRGMDGPTLIERVQRARPEIAVLYMSGYTDDRALRSGLDTTRVPLLYKPFSLRELARAARSALDAARKRRPV